MSTEKLYAEWKKERTLILKSKSEGYGALKNAGFMWGDTVSQIKDFRNELTSQEMSLVESKYGTNNTLFDIDSKRIITNNPFKSGESCQYSSAVWCRIVLVTRNPSINVHESMKEMIRKLYIKYPPTNGNWVWNSSERDPNHSTHLQTDYSLRTPVPGGTYHSFITGQLKKLINSGISGREWVPMLSASTIKHTRAEMVIASALSINGRATLIQMKSHCFAIYNVGNKEMYVFDNTIGCLKFQRKDLVKKFIKWACSKNEELREIRQSVENVRVRQSVYPPWTGIMVR